MTATPLVAALLLLLIIFLSLHVSSTRIRLGISLGTGDNSDMNRAIRAHANALEHGVPFILIALLLEHLAGLADLILWSGLAFFAARVLHAAGMLQRIHRLRQIGATASLALEILLAVILLRAAWAVAIA